MYVMLCVLCVRVHACACVCVKCNVYVVCAFVSVLSESPCLHIDALYIVYIVHSLYEKNWY